MLLMQRLLRLSGLRQLTDASCRVLLQLRRIGLDAIKREQPERNLQHTQLVTQQ